MNKLCTKCGESKPLDAFHQRGGGGLTSHCKVCRNRRSTDYRRAARTKINATRRRSRAKNPAQALARDQRYKALNRGKYAEYARKSRATHLEYFHQRELRWRNANRAKLRERGRQRIAERRDWYIRSLAKNALERQLLSSRYIKSVLVAEGIPRKSIPQDMIEKKREALSLRRLARELKQELTKRSDK